LTVLEVDSQLLFRRNSGSFTVKHTAKTSPSRNGQFYEANAK